MITPAYAQDASGGGASGFLITIFPFVIIFAIIYFLILRPQQKRAREHKAMIESIRRGDVVVTGGGLIGKVHKVGENNESIVELSDGVRVKVVSSTLVDVRSRGEPVNNKDA